MNALKAVMVSAALLGSAFTLGLDYWISLSARPLQVQPGDKLPRPGGLTLEGRPLPESSTVPPCWLIRYASQFCEYCKRDATEYAQLEAHTKGLGCQSILMAPEPSVFPKATNGPADRINLSLTTFEFAAATPFLGTPTTLVLDGHSQVMWSKLGPMSLADITAATAALEGRPHGR